MNKITNGRARKPAGESRDTAILIRLQQKEKIAFQSAAALSGVSLTVWIRTQLRNAAARELRARSKPIPF